MGANVGDRAWGAKPELAGIPKRESPVLEFGGSFGAMTIVIGSHALVYYLWLSITYHRASVVPLSVVFSSATWRHLVVGAAPTGHAALLYFGFLVLQWLLAWTMPGVVVKGLPVPEEGNRRHIYRCN